MVTGVNGAHVRYHVVAALKRDIEKSLKRLCLMAMNIHGMKGKHNPAVVMIALVCVSIIND